MWDMWSITWWRRWITESLKKNNNWPNWRGRLKYSNMKPNTQLMKFMGDIEVINYNKNNEQLWIIHNYRISFHWKDWEQNLWSKCILANEHINHFIQPISKKYIERMDESNQISNQIDEWVANLESSVNLIKEAKSKTKESGCLVFNCYRGAINMQRKIIHDEINLFSNKVISNASSLNDECKQTNNELQNISRNISKYNLKDIQNVVAKARKYISEAKSTVNNFDEDVSKSGLWSVDSPSVFEFTLTNSQIFWKSPVVKLNTIGKDTLWSFFIESNIFKTEIFRIHVDVTDVYNPDREFYCKLEINTLDKQANSNPLEQEAIIDSRETTLKFSINQRWVDKGLRIKLTFQRIDPSEYIYRKKIKDTLNTHANFISK